MERYQQIFLPEQDEIIRPGESFSFTFDYDAQRDEQYRLFFTGEVNNFYYLKSEYYCTLLYQRIDDALIPGDRDAWALRFDGAEYPQLAYRKLVFPLKLSYLSLCAGDEFHASVRVRGEGFRVLEGGHARLRIEIRNRREELTYARQTKYPADRILDFDFPEGTYDWCEVGGLLQLPASEVANLIFSLETERTEGRLYLEQPQLLASNGFNVMPPFERDFGHYQSDLNWGGVNLSRAEWPRMAIEVNGTEIFCDSFFERCHRYSEKEVAIPADVLRAGSNRICFRLLSDWLGALPYRLHEVGIVADPRHSFDVISCPEVAVCGEPIALLLETYAPTAIEVRSEATLLDEPRFDEAGLCVLRLMTDQPQNGLVITLSDGVTTHTVTVSRVVLREPDGVVTGTGDLIYVDQNEWDTMQYFRWYLSQHVGNLLTIRPTYRWSGTRVLNAPMWRRLSALMNRLGMKYSHMIDGREPAGHLAQPSRADLGCETGVSSGYLGRQLHERDGAYGYWSSGENPGEFQNPDRYYTWELFFDQMLRDCHADPEHAGGWYHPVDFFDNGQRFWQRHDPLLPADAKARAEHLLYMLRSIKRDTTRHTGPSIMHKYFCQAGYEWIGAETMDSGTEFLMASIRGAAEAYGIPSVGVHHALQWSTYPHDEPERYRRYRLALYVSWMQGAHENNTEEGLWRLEERYSYHHRHGDACRSHLAQQQDFYRWVLTHSRRGRLRATVGVLHGRYDGYTCFSNTSVWGAPQRLFNGNFDAEQSWHIPRLSFYPNTQRGWTACATNRKKGPIGLVSGNPRGTLNILPVESSFGDYPFLAFFGYNCADAEDLDRLLEKVRAGSTLLLTLAHLTDTTDRAAIQRYEQTYPAHQLLDAIGYEGTPTLVEDRYNGKTLPVATNLRPEGMRILAQTEGGLPLAAERAVGKGSIVILNTSLYPANEAIKPLYTSIFEERSDAALAAEPVAAVVESNVQGVVYEQEDGSHEVYFIAVDWWEDPACERHAKLRIGETLYPVSLPFGVIKKVVVRDGVGILCGSEACDVLELSDTSARLQGCGVQEYRILRNGSVTPVTVDFTEQSVCEISLEG